MRIASRHMPKFTPRPIGRTACLFIAIFIGGFVYAVVSSPAVAAVTLILLAGVCFYAYRTNSRHEEHLLGLAAARQGQSICEFARDFARGSVDTWIIRAVHEQLQWQLKHVHSAFAVRASDRLKEDLQLDDDDLDMDVAVQVEQRTGRSLEHTRANPYYGKVKTVRELVLFFQSQPRRTAVSQESPAR